MNLNLPILKQLHNSTRILFVGVGGGFDVFAGLPVYEAVKSELALTLQRRSYGFVNLTNSKDKFVVRKSTMPADYPEATLPHEVWTIGRNGVQITKDALLEIRKTFEFDTIIGVDGGVDSLMRGDEIHAGTYLEDFVVLTAINEIPNCIKLLTCVGFGTETDEQLNHYRALENIAHLTKKGHFLGSCSLTKHMEEYKIYRSACENAWSNGRKSHIHTKVISAVEGEFGDFHMYQNVDARLHNGGADQPYFISPLMSVYWFFDLAGVVAENPLAPNLKNTSTFTDAMLVNRTLNGSPNRSKMNIPL